jgi:transcriptional regulator with XRE-family HTH domain
MPIPTSPTSRHECFRALLRKKRQDARIRQTELAERLGLPQSFVSKCESGERRVDLLELLEICRALDISLADFVREFEERVRGTE